MPGLWVGAWASDMRMGLLRMRLVRVGWEGTGAAYNSAGTSKGSRSSVDSSSSSPQDHFMSSLLKAALGSDEKYEHQQELCESHLYYSPLGLAPFIGY